MLVSPDAGHTWPVQSHASSALGVISATEWLEIAPSGCRHTTDAGATWTDFGCDYTQAAGVAPAITIAGHQTGYATVRGSIQRTLDGGHHWERVLTPGA